MNKYTLGECIDCKKHTALLNQRCNACNLKINKIENDIPDFLKDIFTEENNDENI
jgi:predicted amidophosphoribosyltransferase